MIDYQKLKTELDIPAYAGMSDLAASVDLSNPTINRIKKSMNGWELLEAQDQTEYIALSDSKKSQWLSLTSMLKIDPQGQAVNVVTDIWGNGSTTISNLAALRQEDVSKVTELELGLLADGAFVNTVSEFDVRHARSL